MTTAVRRSVKVRRHRRAARRLSRLAAGLAKELGRAILALGVALVWALVIVA